jgi:hypothetical protein
VNTEHGDSGSWVVSDGRLCGYIVAGKDSVPWAYMVQIEEVFDQLKQCYPDSPRICHPINRSSHAFSSVLESPSQSNAHTDLSKQPSPSSPSLWSIQNDCYDFGTYPSSSNSPCDPLPLSGKDVMNSDTDEKTTCLKYTPMSHVLLILWMLILSTLVVGRSEELGEQVLKEWT